MLPVSVWTEEEVKFVIKTEIGDDSVFPLFLPLLPLSGHTSSPFGNHLSPPYSFSDQHRARADSISWKPGDPFGLNSLPRTSNPAHSQVPLAFPFKGVCHCVHLRCHPLWLNQQILRWHHCLGLLNFTDIPFVTYWRSVATLHWAYPSVTFFQQHSLTLCLCITICYGDLWSVTFEATVVIVSGCHACCWLILRNCHTHPNLQQTRPWCLVSGLQHRGKTLSQHKDYDSWKAEMIPSTFFFFTNNVFFWLKYVHF